MSRSEEHDGREAIDLGGPDEEPEGIDCPVSKGEPSEGHGDERVGLVDDIVRLQQVHARTRETNHADEERHLSGNES